MAGLQRAIERKTMTQSDREELRAIIRNLGRNGTKIRSARRIALEAKANRLPPITPAQHTPYAYFRHLTGDRPPGIRYVEIVDVAGAVHKIDNEIAIRMLNAHDALVEALREALPHIRYKNQTTHLMNTDVDLLVDKIECALALAEER